VMEEVNMGCGSSVQSEPVLGPPGVHATEQQAPTYATKPPKLCETKRWNGTQLGVGVLGRHRRCCIELAKGGILRLLENAGTNSLEDEGGGKRISWTGLGRRSTVLYDCWVSSPEPMSSSSCLRKIKPG
jgi:hypothetical protein